MSLATLFNVPTGTGDQTAFDEFSFSNQDSHNKIIAAIFAQKNITLTIYQVDPMVFEGDVWLGSLDHQAMHNDMNGVTGVLGNDWTSVDWNDPQQASYFHQLHGAEHQQNEQILGITG
jgi:hypothetical protein